MKTVNFMLAAIALLFGLTACMQSELVSRTSSSEVTTEEMENTPIVFTASVDGDWNGVNTSVAVKIDDTVKEYSVTATDNTSATLSSDDPYYWTDSNEITVTAWWPYTEGEIAPPNVVVNADQSTSDGFEGSNFISAENQTVQSDDPTLVFTQRTARVTINVTSSDVPQYVKLTGLSTANGNPSEITAYNTSGTTYVALVAPQTLAQSTVSITCEFSDGDLSFEQSAAVWEAGQEYTYTVSRVVQGSGYTYDSVNNTYTVYTANGLLAWNEAAQSDLTLNCTLSSNITINSTWTPVGDNSNPYTGTFEGGNYTITGLTVNQSGENYVGLIGFLGSDGKVQNLTLEEVNITGLAYAGGVVGRNWSGTVTDCTVTGTVSGHNHVGGVLGGNFATLTSCTFSGTVSGDSYYVGGVTGYNNGTVTACSASGNVSGNKSFIGGVVGFNTGSDAKVTACYHVSGNVSGSGPQVGGVAGYNSDSGSLTACYHASGSISGEYTIGGVVGFNTGSVTACYWSDYDGNGFGYDSYGGEATKVDGTTMDWWTAAGFMNLESDGTWQYVQSSNPPTLNVYIY